MTCEDFDGMICDYLDGTLSPAKRQLAATHIASCHRKLTYSRRFVDGECVEDILYRSVWGVSLTHVRTSTFTPYGFVESGYIYESCIQHNLTMHEFHDHVADSSRMCDQYCQSCRATRITALCGVRHFTHTRC